MSSVPGLDRPGQGSRLVGVSIFEEKVYKRPGRFRRRVFRNKNEFFLTLHVDDKDHEQYQKYVFYNSGSQQNAKSETFSDAHIGWKKITIPLSDFSSIGSASWNSVKKILITYSGSTMDFDQPLFSHERIISL